MKQETDSIKSVNHPEKVVVNTGVDMYALTEYLVERELERRENAKLPKVTRYTMCRAASNAVAQGVWTAISYFAETDKVGAMKIADELGCSLSAIHEFDWERLVEVYGSKSEFKRLYSRVATSIKVVQLANEFVDGYLMRKKQTFLGELSSKDETETHCQCIYIGSSLVLGMISKFNPREAKNISGIICTDY